jgi:hypothetical protein
MFTIWLNVFNKCLCQYGINKKSNRTFKYCSKWIWYTGVKPIIHQSELRTTSIINFNYSIPFSICYNTTKQKELFSLKGTTFVYVLSSDWWIIGLTPVYQIHFEQWRLKCEMLTDDGRKAMTKKVEIFELQYTGWNRLIR